MLRSYTVRSEALPAASSIGVIYHGRYFYVYKTVESPFVDMVRQHFSITAAWQHACHTHVCVCTIMCLLPCWRVFLHACLILFFVLTLCFSFACVCVCVLAVFECVSVCVCVCDVSLCVREGSGMSLRQCLRVCVCVCVCLPAHAAFLSFR